MIKWKSPSTSGKLHNPNRMSWVIRQIDAEFRIDPRSILYPFRELGGNDSKRITQVHLAFWG